MEAVRTNSSQNPETVDSAPPSYFDIIDSAPPPPNHSIFIPKDDEELITQVTSRGISDEWARIALRRCSGNVDDAIRLCIESGALDDQTQPLPRPTKKKKGGVVSRTLGALKRSSDKSDRTVPQAAITVSLPEPPPAYDAIVRDGPEVPLELDFADLPSYDQIVGQPDEPPLPITSEGNSSEVVPVPPRPPRRTFETLTTTSEHSLNSGRSLNSEQSTNSETSETVSNSTLDTNGETITPKSPNPPPLLSETQKKSWRGWKHSESSSEISPVCVSVSDEFSSDVIVQEMRTTNDELEKEELEMTQEEEVGEEKEEDTDTSDQLENIVSPEQTPMPMIVSSQQIENYPNTLRILETPNISSNLDSSNHRPLSTLSFDDVVSSDDESSPRNEPIRAMISIRGISQRQNTMETLIDRNESHSPPIATTWAPDPEFSREVAAVLNSPPSTQGMMNDTHDVPSTELEPVAPLTLVVAGVEQTFPPANRPQSVRIHTNPYAQTLPLQLPSHVVDELSSTPLPPRPMSLSRLPRATSVLDDSLDDDTIHGEAYVQVSLSSVALRTAVADLYIRDESGGLYMAVAAPLTSVDEDDQLVIPAQVRDGQGEEPANQNRGLFSYARNRLYGEQQNRRREIEGGVRRRVFLPFDIEERDGNFFPILYLTQPKLGTNSGPQHNRPPLLRMTPSTSRNLSVRHAEVNTPPLWDGGADRKECSICLHTAGLLYKIHHCRNCGHYVCNNCSKKDWLATMLPRTYVPDKETVIRVCDNCSYLQEGFMDALRAGDLNRSMVFYLTGNVNVHCPMSIYKSEEYPIHTAIQGGNIHLVRWLIEDRRCTLRDDGEPLRTAEGLSPLSVAAFYGHRDIMQYLVQQQGSRVTEIKDLSILVRGLHSALEVSYSPRLS
jgi:hypothetical protein